jgi:hypothetical protein
MLNAIAKEIGHKKLKDIKETRKKIISLEWTVGLPVKLL